MKVQMLDVLKYRGIQLITVCQYTYTWEIIFLARNWHGFCCFHLNCGISPSLEKQSHGKHRGGNLYLRMLSAAVLHGNAISVCCLPSVPREYIYVCVCIRRNRWLCTSLPSFIQMVQKKRYASI